MKFYIRDLVWLTLLVAVILGWQLQVRQLRSQSQAKLRSSQAEVSKLKSQLFYCQEKRALLDADQNEILR